MLSFFVRFLSVSVPVLGFVPSAAYSATSSDEDLEDFYSLSLAELANIEITIATGNTTPLYKAPSTATVITSNEIRAMGARTLDEVLEFIPGFHVSLSTLSRLDSVYSIRGIHTGFNPHVLMLVNGVPIQNGFQGGRPLLFRLSTSAIERVEVIRGPGSAIYGADAFSGVINVKTKDAASISEPSAGFRSGSFGIRDAWFEGQSSINDWDLALMFSYISSDGDDSRILNADFQTFLDAFYMTSASLAPGPLATNYSVYDTRLAISNEDWTLNLWHWFSDDSGVGAGAAQALDYEGSDSGELIQADLSYDLDDKFEFWQLHSRAAYTYYELDTRLNIFPAGAAVPIGNDGNVDFITVTEATLFPDGLIGTPSGFVEDFQLDFFSIYTGFDDHRVRVALGARQQSIDTNEAKNFGPGVIDGSESEVTGVLVDVSDSDFVYIPDSSRTLMYFSLQDEWNFFSGWNLVSGIRFDEFSDFGNTVNPRIGVVWETNSALTSKLLYGSAFRAPSFSEQFFQNNPVSLGNPEIQPENIDTIEVSLTHQVTEKIQHTLSIYSYQARDMIEYVQDEFTATSTAQNLRDQDGYGVEWELFWTPIERLKIDANFSWQEAKDARSSEPVPDAPGHQFSVKAYWAWHSKWSLSSRFNFVADRERNMSDIRPDVDDYMQLDLTLNGENILPNLNFTLAIRNLSDETQYEPSAFETLPEDYLLESRSAWASVQYSF